MAVYPFHPEGGRKHGGSGFSRGADHNLVAVTDEPRSEIAAALLEVGKFGIFVGKTADVGFVVVGAPDELALWLEVGT